MAILLALAACGGDVSGTPEGTAGSPVETRIRPYVDASLTALPLEDMAGSTGVDNAVLSFVLAGGNSCTPSWGGTRALTDPALAGAAKDLTARGGEITVATGGANGPYLENVCTDSEALAGAYRAALDAVASNRLDVDIEAEVPVGTVVAALKSLQDERGTAVSLTLPVAGPDEGLTPAGLALARAADEAGVAVEINAMIMNFPARGDWAAAMTNATGAVLRQVQELRPDESAAAAAARTGVTFMLGRTDLGAVTTLDDAAAVTRDARARGLGSVGFWSAARDNGGCPDASAAAFDCSGITQSRFAFTEIVRDTLADTAPPEENAR
ncbi:MAG: carbohydrate-binding protein CenC [Pseudonocardia sp.]|nr:carbohydrate-binding protein CenC [Pseudonocardia sp.]